MMRSILAVLCCCIYTVTVGLANPPNIVFMMSDDHACSAVSAYGSKIIQTPNIDRIAQQGVRFENSFCTNSICAPSRAVILTGKYSHLNGQKSNSQKFDSSQPTLPKYLKAAGYETAIVGKWHLRSAPTGFDHYEVLPGQGNYRDPKFIRNGEPTHYQGYVTNVVTDLALQWLEERKGERPFFLMLHHKAPHANWIADQQDLALYRDSNVPLPDTFNDDYQSRTAQIKTSLLRMNPATYERHQFAREHGKIPEGLGEQELREWIFQRYIKSYLRCVASVDRNVGRVLDWIDESGQSDNTLIVYTSDQGFFLGEHGLYDKRFMYEPSLRMPLLIRYPDAIPAGSVRDEMVLNVDFASTLLDYAGTNIPPELQGASFRQIADGGQVARWRDDFYYRFYEQAYEIGPHEGIRTTDYKLIHFLYGDHGWELFHLKDDPEELHNLESDPSYDTILTDLKARMESRKKELKVF